MKSPWPGASELLASHHLKVTRTRRLIMEYLHVHAGHHTVENLAEALNAAGPPVQISTLYMNLKSFERAGLVRALSDGTVTRYELSGEDHAHRVCRSCGKIDDVPFPESFGLPEQPAGWQIDRVDLRLLGHCPACARQSP